MNAGQVLWRSGEPSDSFYIVINGRLRAIQENGGDVSISAEYGQGDSVSILHYLLLASPYLPLILGGRARGHH